mmetsp:Transcript_32668/g.66753  ORF Transcript_32668/g.66753 Transcript_32668/m.66753 type:complete len:103 (-) Transcript_32668:140-448(-)
MAFRARSAATLVTPLFTEHENLIAYLTHTRAHSSPLPNDGVSWLPPLPKNIFSRRNTFQWHPPLQGYNKGNIQPFLTTSGLVSFHSGMSCRHTLTESQAVPS